MLLNNRPSANDYFNSTALQEWTRATNVRIRLRRTKNLLGHLMSVVSKDPSVTRRVNNLNFYLFLIIYTREYPNNDRGTFAVFIKI